MLHVLTDPTPGARLKFQRNGANRAPSKKWPGLEQFSLNTLQLTQLFISHLSNSLFTGPGNGTGQGATSLAMTRISVPGAPRPQDDLKTVVETRTREWHFHIYFLLQSPTETAAALALRDAVLRLRRDGENNKTQHRP